MFCLSFLLISTNYDYSSCIWFPCCSAWLTLSSWDHQSKPTSSRTNCINISTLAPLASPCFISWHLVSCQFCYLKNATRLWKQTLETCWAILASSPVPQLEVFDTPTSGPPTFSWPHWRKLNSSAASLKWPAKRIAHERTKHNRITWWVALHLFWGVVQSCISRQLRKTPHKPPRNLVLGVKIKMMLHHDFQYYIVTIYFALGITIGIIDCRLLAMLPTKNQPHPDIPWYIITGLVKHIHPSVQSNLRVLTDPSKSNATSHWDAFTQALIAWSFGRDMLWPSLSKLVVARRFLLCWPWGP